MSAIRVHRRLSELEDRLALQRPPPPLPEALSWLPWVSNAELDELERVFRRAADQGRDVSPVEQQRVLEIEAAATRRILASEPPV